MAMHNLGKSQLSFNLCEKGEQGGFSNGKLSFISVIYVYALVYMLCTNVHFMHLSRYCSGYVTLGIKGVDFIFVFCFLDSQ